MVVVEGARCPVAWFLWVVVSRSIRRMTMVIISREMLRELGSFKCMAILMTLS